MAADQDAKAFFRERVQPCVFTQPRLIPSVGRVRFLAAAKSLAERCLGGGKSCLIPAVETVRSAEPVPRLRPSPVNALSGPDPDLIAFEASGRYRPLRRFEGSLVLFQCPVEAAARRFIGGSDPSIYVKPEGLISERRRRPNFVASSGHTGTPSPGLSAARPEVAFDRGADHQGLPEAEA